MLKTKRLWEERFHPAERGWGIFDLSFYADDNQLLVAGFEKGLHLFKLESISSSISEKTHLKAGHKSCVHKVEWHSSGRRFATAGTDRLVVIWKDDFTPERQIKFDEVPQVLAWNPKLLNLIAAAGMDFVIVNLPREPIFYRVQSPIWSAAWDSNGEIYALGLENGVVSIRDRRDNETGIINRSGSPIWCVAFAPLQSTVKSNLLIVADWSGCVGLYEANGRQHGTDYYVDFLPVSLNFSADGQILYFCGADKKVHALSWDCAEVATVAEFRAWPQKFLAVEEKTSRGNFVAITADGVVTMMEASCTKCSHMHGSIYASRDSLVTLSVRNLERNREATLPIQEPVVSLAVYNNLLAWLTPSELVIQQQVGEDVPVKYEEQARVAISEPCKILLLAARHALLVRETTVVAISFAGHTQHSWSFPTNSQIQIAKVIGGSPGAELFIVALKNGSIFRLLINQPFIKLIVKVPNVPVMLDINRTVQKLAVVCENSVLYAYNMDEKRLLFQESGADSCAWNLYHADVLAFSNRGLMKIKLGEHKGHMRRMETPLNGPVVGYIGSKLFYDTPDGLATVDVPHTMLIHQSVDEGDFETAYEIACFGAADSDWKMLGNTALEKLSFGIAKQCFRRLRDYPTVMLIEDLEQRQLVNDGNADIYLADILAHRGRFDDAARLYASGGRSELAVKMFTEIRMFEKADQWATDPQQKRELLKMRAEWAVTANERATAVELLIQLEEYGRAFEVMKDIGWIRRILEVSRKLDVITHKEALIQAAKFLLDAGDTDGAVEVFERLKDIDQIVAIQLRRQAWDYLVVLAEKEPFHREAILLPYAQYLVKNDRFVKARENFTKAGHPEMAVAIINDLVQVSVTTNKFSDAGFYHWLLGRNAEEDLKQETADQHYLLAELYQAYSLIESAVNDPFIQVTPEVLFNAGRILAAQLWQMKGFPKGIRMSYILYTVGIRAAELEAHKTCRTALERLKRLVIPKRMIEKFMEVWTLNQLKPFTDPEDLSDFCHSCSAFVPLLNVKNGLSCQICEQPFFYCHVSYEQLPIVEFFLPPDISVAEACSLISRDPGGKPIQHSGEGDVAPSHRTDKDIFFTGWSGKGPITVRREQLLALQDFEVIIQKRPKPLRWKFFKNLLPDVAQVVTCTECWQFFSHDDWFAKILETKACPFCRSSAQLST